MDDRQPAKMTSCQLCGSHVSLSGAFHACLSCGLQVCAVCDWGHPEVRCERCTLALRANQKQDANQKQNLANRIK